MVLVLTTIGDIEAYLVVGFCAGIYVFFRGFRTYREYRVLADTPEMPIRSIAMGLVEIHGKVKGEKLVNSPVTNTPCFFYKVDIEACKTDSRGRGSWSHVATDGDGVPFYLEDQTGRVLVDAHGAELDLIQSDQRETARGAGRTWGRLFGGVQDPTLATGKVVPDGSLGSYAESVIASKPGSSFGDNLVSDSLHFRRPRLGSRKEVL